MLLVALLYPSPDIAEALSSLPWREKRCQKAWAAVGTQVAAGSLHLAEALARLTPELQEWLTPLAMEQRSYREASDMLKRFIDAWHRQSETLELGKLRQEIDSMLEGRIPMDPDKVAVFNDLSRRLKGSPKETPQEATLHGRNANTHT